MSFTDRFIKLPAKVPNEIYNSEDDVTIRIRPADIESYFNDRKEGKDVVVVQTKSADLFTVFMNIRDFEKRLNEFERGAEEMDYGNTKQVRS